MVTEEAKMETGARILKGKHPPRLFSGTMSPFSELGLLTSMKLEPKWHGLGLSRTECGPVSSTPRCQGKAWS